MKTAIIGAVILIFAGCAGINRLSASRMTTSQLWLRLSQTNRELSAIRSEHDNSMIESERDAIERELLARCEAGDPRACSWRWSAMSEHQKRAL